MARHENLYVNKLTVNKAVDADGSNLAVDSRDKVVLWEDFTGTLVATLDSNGWNALPAAGNVVVAGAAGGTATVTELTGVDDSGAMLVGNADMSVKANYGGLKFEARVALTAITQTCVCIGLTDSAAQEEPMSYSGTTLTTTASDAALFVFDIDGTTDQWVAASVDSDTDDTGSGLTGVAPVAGTYQTFRIEVSSDGTTIKFFIDGKHVKTLSTAGITETVALYPVVSVYNRAGVAQSAAVDYIRIEYDRQ